MSEAPVTTEVRELDADGYRAAIPALARLVLDAVASGSGVSFLDGATQADAAAWWGAQADQVADGTISAFVAFDGPDIVGSVLLVRSRHQNSPHRAEVAKVIVLGSHRRRGVARQLMAAAEARARTDGRWMLMLDTVTGSAADTFYRATGWHELGVMPNHALLPDGTPAPTTFFWKDLR